MIKNKSLKTIYIRIAKKLLPESLFLYVKKNYYKFNPSLFSPDNEPELNILKYLIKVGDYTIDIGANIGVYAKNLSELVGINGKVIAVEPIPLTFQVLESNIKYYNLNNVTPVNVAISEECGNVKMTIPKSINGNENYYEAKIIQNTENFYDYVNIKAITLDSLTEKFDNIFSFIKIDVEGHELSCIKGASKLLEKSNPILLIEVSSNPDESSSHGYELFQRLEKLGYTSYWIENEKFVKRNPGDIKLNNFFFTQKHILEFKNYF